MVDVVVMATTMMIMIVDDDSDSGDHTCENDDELQVICEPCRERNCSKCVDVGTRKKSILSRL